MINKILKNKVKLLIAIILILIIILVVSMFIFFTDNSTKPSYGNRLDGIEEVEISKKQTEDMKNKIKKNSNVKDVTYNIQGKIVNVTITVNSATTVSGAKELANKVTSYFEKDQVAFYDFQVFVKNEDKNKKSFPIIGYKKSSSSSFSYTKDRGDN